MEAYKINDLDTRIRIAETRLQIALINEAEKNILNSIRRAISNLKEMRDRTKG